MIKEEIYRFYCLARADIVKGCDVQLLEDALERYEKMEYYEACAGIKEAMEEAGYKTIRELINDIEDEQRND